MAKRQPSSQRASQGAGELSDKVQLQKEAVSLDQRLVSGRNVPIEKVRESAKIEVTGYSKDPAKYLAKIKRGNVLVAQELVSRGDYSVEQVTNAYRQEVLAGGYDSALTDVYQEQKAKRSASWFCFFCVISVYSFSVSVL